MGGPARFGRWAADVQPETPASPKSTGSLPDGLCPSSSTLSEPQPSEPRQLPCDAARGRHRHRCQARVSTRTFFERPPTRWLDISVCLCRRSGLHSVTTDASAGSEDGSAVALVAERYPRVANDPRAGSAARYPQQTSTAECSQPAADRSRIVPRTITLHPLFIA